MGRYYSGDIEGKFWFGVQSSDDASFFGGEQSEPSHIHYYFGTEDLTAIKEGLKICKEELGKYKEKIDKFFEKHNAYNNEMLDKALKTNEQKVKELLVWYARLELGKKIYNCVKKNSYCQFEAEL